VEKALKEMRNRKATGDDDIPGDGPKLLGKEVLKILTELSNTMYNNGEWPQDFTEVTVIVLMKKTKTSKCSDYRTISLIAHIAKIIANIVIGRIVKKIEGVLGDEQFGFRGGKGTRNAIGMMRIVAEWTLEIDECLLHRLAEGIRPCKLDQINADPKENWH
jgi:hypothetical protein